MSQHIKTDVLISGGGPVGLLIAYSLTRQGINTIVVEQHDKEQQAIYGRARTLYPRMPEMLDQLDLLDHMNQIGFIGRNSVTHKDGERVTSRGWHTMFQRMEGTYLDYCLNIRQKYSEGVFRDAYKTLGGEPYIGWKLESFSVDHAAEDDYKVISLIRDLNTDEANTVKSKYLVGADGGHSLVRRLAGITSESEQTEYKWIRIDGHLKTNMPDAHMGFASIESKSHGNVLWVQLDHRAKRIGFAVTEMLAKYGERLTEEDAKRAAIKAMEPFTLEFESVDWWTLYSDNGVILAGDACHTHSSGAAQGMNTGVHDAVNLSWKLGGMIKGWYTKEVIETYNNERRGAAQYLIELDKGFSDTISGQIPEIHKGRYTDANELFTKLFDETVQFNIGLGVYYEENIINKAPSTGMISAGWRAPDSLVYAPGSQLPTRLFTLTKNHSRWSIIIFAGQPVETGKELAVATDKLHALASALPEGMVRFLTIVGQHVSNGDQYFGIPRLGHMCFDPDQSAHTVYSISPMNGAVVVLRPDGLLAYATTLDKVCNVATFFEELTQAA